MKQKKSLAALVGVIAVLVALNYWDNWESTKDKNQKEASTRLFQSKSSDVEKIQFQSHPQNEGESETSLEITKKDNQWWVTKPLNVLADQRNVENLLKTLYEYNYARIISKDPEAKGNFGFDKSNRTIILSDHSGKSTTLQIGMTAPVGYDVYSTFANKPEVYIGSQYLLIATGKSLFDFRNKKVVKVNVPKIEKFSYFRKLKNETVKFDFEKEASGTFAFVDQNGMKYEGDTAGIRDFWEDIDTLHAKAFIDSPSKAQQKDFANPEVALSWNEDGENKLLLFVKKQNVYYAAVDPSKLIIELPDNSQVRIEKDIINFRNRKVFGFETSMVDSVKIDGDTFKNIDGSWYTVEEAAKKIDRMESPHIRALMMDLEFAQTFAYIQLHDKLLKELPKAPSHRITLAFKKTSDRSPEVIDVFPVPEENNYRYIKHTSGKYLYKIDNKILQSLTASEHENISEKVGEEPTEDTHDPDLDRAQND